MNWLQEIPLSSKAADTRRTLAPDEFRAVQRAAENLALITARPVAEVADRLLCSIQSMADGEGSEEFMSLLADIVAENT